MNNQERVSVTAESVTEGHPDKICDQISDGILDAILEKDPEARVALETLITTGAVHVAGEVTTSTYVEIPQLVRQIVSDIGYRSSVTGFDGETCGVLLSIDQQSPDIAQSVHQSLEAREAETSERGGDPRDAQGAGDQGLMYGYASAETPDLMPAPIWLAHRLAERLAFVRKEGLVTGLRPDGKSQVTLTYEDGRPVAVDTIVLSAHHDPSWDQDELRQALTENVVAPVLEDSGLGLDTSQMRLLVNPSGRFVVGGPAGDTGLTGRKIIVDTYGGGVPHGGGAFSGKDPSKVDRSGAYAARWVAKNVVAAGLAEKCQVLVAYAIGSSAPVSVTVDSFGTGIVPDAEIAAAVEDVFDLRPLGIIEDLDLLNVRYLPTATYGHFGREGFPWEATDRAPALRAALGLESAD